MVAWRSACWLALVLILAGTPARQVEAADDCARTMAEAGTGDRVEEEDGGVGDDALEATRNADSAPTDGVGPAAGPVPGDAWACARGFDLMPPPDARSDADRPGRVEEPPEAGRRQAQLGRFRF